MNAMVIDTSAAVAVLRGEPSGAAVVEAINAAGEVLISAASLVELGIVLEAVYGPVGGTLAERFVNEAGIRIVDVDQAQARLAISGWRRFGKGRHPAALNFGDSFTYALAAGADLPVVCLRNDFAQTDIEVVRA